MKRKEVWWINFDPSVGGEIQKKRPAIIISNDISNDHLNRVQVIPLSSNIEYIYPCETLLVIENKSVKAMADQLTTVSKKRIVSQMSEINDEQMLQIEFIIKLQLGF